ncbi:TIGR02281 family clan AA aspartic protease [Azoarcus sp. L1K30]|uniref:retropepsin-like aspartic protease family protein n=1 Tax=Azoarcus sp. L1K30 TaxID=2820277 RepID=UPI002011C592|nr:TIGR02281 family clan AA aspartic protease [Azoarcus sp. L1K30]
MGFPLSVSRMLIVSFSLASPAICAAAEVAVAGVLGTRAAVLVIDGGSPRTLAIGQRSPEGVRLLAIEGEVAVVEVDKVRERVRLGERVVRRAADGRDASVHLEADGQGHFLTTGRINGASVRFLVDTGASVVSIGRADARRLGIDLTRATLGRTQTANGVVNVWRVKLDSVQLGELSLNDVDAVVLENDMPLILLGMSFLNRMEMARDGNRLVLRRRY